MAKDLLDRKTWSVDQSQKQGGMLSEIVPELFFGIIMLK